jgi:tRNA/tmRNA/rRNA uracil-C5-methylase (TrmA/RlmC/RlmD family)
MVSGPTQTITVDRISNSGNPVAASEYNGKTIHVPAGVPGETLDVRLVDKGGYWRATVVDRGKRNRTGTQQPAQAGASEPLLELGAELCDETLTIQQRETTSNLGPAEYPGKDHRSEIAQRHD